MTETEQGMDQSQAGLHMSVDKVSVRSVTLSDYRNYSALSLPLSGRHVVLTGANGSGKTNLLEAISFLSPGARLAACRLSGHCTRNRFGSLGCLCQS